MDPRKRIVAQGYDRMSQRYLEWSSRIEDDPRHVTVACMAEPDPEFIDADVAALEMPDESFDGVVALYALSHVSREEHAQLFARINRWLVPGGLFLTNRHLVRAAGFEFLIDETLVTREPDGDVRFLWVLAQKPSKKAREL
jgi:predicted methyltransferase